MAETSAGDSRDKKNGLWRRIVRAVRGLDQDATAEAIADELRKREDEGEPLGGAQRDMLLKAARFDQLLVGDVMKPRAHIIGVEASATLAEVAMLFAESQHSRLPVYRDTLDDPLGFVHVKDVMALLAPNAEGPPSAKPTDRVLTRIKRDVLYVPSSMRLPNLLLRMRTARSHIALVVDEYGGTDGLVTIEDLVEQIVGAIDDEYDTEEASLIQARPGGVFEVDGRADVESVEKALGVSLALPEQDDDFDTAAGLAVALIGRVPQRGEVLRHPAGVDIEVFDADPRKIKKLKLRLATAGGEGAA